MKDDKVSPLTEGWLREIGIQDPSSVTPEQVEEAWKHLEEDLGITTDMVQDIHEAIEILRRDTNMTEQQKQFVEKHLTPRIMQALTRMKEMCQDMGDNKRGVPITWEKPRNEA
jgi:hypothetical protein